MTATIPTDETALFEVLNAKKMSPQEIGRSFVLLAQFDQLITPDHAYLVGPRGSGKTTLLRMLQGQTLMEWDHQRATEYRRRIRYSSVFLPADRLWVSQTTEGPVHSDTGNPFSTAAFCTQMLSALIETLQYRIGYFNEGETPVHLPVDIPPSDEASLVGECAEAWRLSVRSNTLTGLLGALDLRLNSLATIMDPDSPSIPTIDILAEYPWLALSPVEAFRFGIRAINRYTRQPNHRWALLLDEMELAPQPVHRALTAALRGGERNLVLKLSFSPFDRYISTGGLVGGPVEGNDFRAIYLWYGSRVGGRRFASGLWRRMSTDILDTSVPAVRVLGQSQLDTIGTTWRANPYGENSRRSKLLAHMYDNDPTFAAWARGKRLDPRSLERLTSGERASTLRKAYPLLVFRDAMMEFRAGRPPKIRSRKKVTEAFSGADAIFAALEGNPRWMKAVFTTLLLAYSRNNRVDPGEQFDALSSASERFESLLRVLPNEQDLYSFPVLDLLDAIASNFQRRLLTDFTADPPLSFRVDTRVSDDIQAALRTALSAGAIVHMREKRSPVVLSSLQGERFRLAYLLCVRDGKELPLRLGKPVDLSRVLAEEARAVQTSHRLKTALQLNPTLPFFSGTEA